MTYRHPQHTAVDQAQRALREEARARFSHVDFETFIASVKSLPVFQDCPRSIAKTEVRLVFTYAPMGGYAHGNRFVRIRISSKTPIAWALETIVHELVHAALPSRISHNERYRLTLARAVRELWGIAVDPNPKNEKGRVPVYLLDRNIEEILSGALEIGWLSYPKRAPAPPAAPPDPAALVAQRRARLDELREKRYQRAVKMFARANKRALAAEKTRSKWLKKVRYYEKIAAKKGGST